VDKKYTNIQAQMFLCQYRRATRELQTTVLNLFYSSLTLAIQMPALLIDHYYPVAARSDRHGNAQDINSRVCGWQAERINVRVCQAPRQSRKFYLIGTVVTSSPRPYAETLPDRGKVLPCASEAARFFHVVKSPI